MFDADTIFPRDTFRLAAGGLESYDVVRAKRTVRNHGDGWLRRLEAMGTTARCHAIYATTTGGPYQLLGKAYVVRVAELWNVDDGRWTRSPRTARWDSTPTRRGSRSD